MELRNIAKKSISLLLSAIMVITMVPALAFSSFAQDTAATTAVVSNGIWTHSGSKDYETESGNGANCTSMWLRGTEFSFMQTQDNESMELATEFWAFKNDGGNYSVINSIEWGKNTDTTFVPESLSFENIGNVGTINPSGSILIGLPGSIGSGYAKQKTNNTVKLKLTVAFTANGSATYNPKLNIKYTAGISQLTGTSSYSTEASSENPLLVVNVIDLRPVNSYLTQAQTVLGYDNLSDANRTRLQTVVDSITADYTLDGSVYYPQNEITSLENTLSSALKCDYSAFDSAMAKAAEVRPDNDDLCYGAEEYSIFTDAYNAAKSLSTELNIDADNINQSMVDKVASNLQEAVDTLNRTKAYVVTFMNDNGTILDEIICQQAARMYFHDALQQVTAPSKDSFTFDYWMDNNGQEIPESLFLSGDITAYPHFSVISGDSAVEKTGVWNHKTNQTGDYAGRGTNYVTMSVASTVFKFVQTQDNQRFAFTTAFTGCKNDGANNAKITSIDFAADSDPSFLPDKTEWSIVSNPGNSITTLPGSFYLSGFLGSGNNAQLQNKTAVIECTYTFIGQGSKTYSPSWNIQYQSGAFLIMTSRSTAADNENPTFTITVTDMRQLISTVATANELLSEYDADLTGEQKTALTNALKNYTDNIVLDGTVYYEQSVVDAAQAELSSVIDTISIPCDYTALDKATEDASDIITENDGRYKDAEWGEYVTALTNANAVDRNLTIDPTGANQKLIDSSAKALTDAIQALDYATHKNGHCDYSELNAAVESTSKVITENDGRYADDAWNDYKTALDNANELIKENLYADDNGVNQAAIDEAAIILEDALAVLNNETNLNYVIIVKDENDETLNMIYVGKTTETTFGEIKDSISEPPSDENHSFVSWQDDYGNDIADDTVITGSMVIRPHFELSKITPDVQKGDLTVDRETEYTYMVGVSPVANTVADLKAQLENNEVQIIVTRNDAILSETDLVGTGCVVKCVSAKNPNVVYEVATVILYGDVDGDGKIDEEDMSTLRRISFLKEQLISNGTVFFIAADVNGDGVLDAFDYFATDRQITGSVTLDQTLTLYK